MNGNLIVTLGQDQDDMAVLQRAASEFGFLATAAHDLREIAATQQNRLAAVLLQRDAFGPGIHWKGAIQRLRLTLPHVRIVTCHHFDDSIDWGEIYDLGTYHAIRLPLHEQEVRQSLGFIWQAEQREAALESKKLVPIERKKYGRMYEGEPVLTYAAR